MTARVVFPDGDPVAEQLLAGDLTGRLDALGGFAFHPDAPSGPAGYLERIGSAEAMLLGWGLPVEVLHEAPALKVVSFTGTGAANFVDLEVARARGIAVTNTPDYAADAVAEHALALTLAAVKGVVAGDRRIRRGEWEGLPSNPELAELTVGVLGLGGIGRRYAELMRLLGARVIAWSPSAAADPSRYPGVEIASLETVLSSVDVLAVHLGLRPETRGFLDADRLALLRPGTVLVNTARGELLDESAFHAALDDGRIGVAALDVFHQEPLPADSALLAREDVILTPHVGSHTEAATRRVLEIAVSNIEAFFEGREQNRVA